VKRSSRILLESSVALLRQCLMPYALCHMFYALCLVRRYQRSKLEQVGL